MRREELLHLPVSCSACMPRCNPRALQPARFRVCEGYQACPVGREPSDASGQGLSHAGLTGRWIGPSRGYGCAFFFDGGAGGSAERWTEGRGTAWPKEGRGGRQGRREEKGKRGAGSNSADTTGAGDDHKTILRKGAVVGELICSADTRLGGHVSMGGIYWLSLT